MSNHCGVFCSDVGVGQSQDDSIVGMKQSKQIPPALPVSGNLSSSNPDLLQSHHRILDFNNQPGNRWEFTDLWDVKQYNISSNANFRSSYYTKTVLFSEPVPNSEYIVSGFRVPLDDHFSNRSLLFPWFSYFFLFQGVWFAFQGLDFLIDDSQSCLSGKCGGVEIEVLLN